jgi:hypothetical protein
MLVSQPVVSLALNHRLLAGTLPAPGSTWGHAKLQDTREMEFSLHRQLKEHYGAATRRYEERIDGYRIDAVGRQGRLIEIQHGSLAAIRNKIGRLLATRRVLVVKPLVGVKRLVSLDREDGEPVSRRLSPKRQQVLDLFRELVYFTQVFPHRNLWLEAAIVEIEEVRFPGHGRRRRWRDSDYRIADQRLVAIQSTRRFSKAADLLSLLPSGLANPFHTGDLAQGLAIDRTFAQQIAYCLRRTGAALEVGKSGNARLYELAVAGSRY